MSETAPRSNPRLDNFEANKAKSEKEAWESELYGEAGTTDFSDEAHARVEEADTYERHMEALANDDRSAFDRNYNHAEPLEGPVPGTMEHAEEEAYAENKAREDEEEARLAAEEAAREAKFATDPKLRRMDMIARDIAKRKNTLVTPENQDSAPERIAELEDKLNELLADYEASDDYDSVIADQIIDRTTAPAPMESKKTETEEETKPEDAEESAPANPDDSKTEDKPSEKVPGKELVLYTGPRDNDPETNESNEDDTLNLPPLVADPLAETPEEAPAADEERSRKERLIGKGSWLRNPLQRMRIAFDSFRNDEEKKGTRKGAAIALGAVAVVGGAVWAAVAMSRGWSTGGTGSQTADHLTGGTGGQGALAGSGLPGGEGAQHLAFSPEAHMVTHGEGWLNELNELGIPKDQHSHVLQELLQSKDPEIKGWVYQMKNGTPGISHTGQIPDSVLEKIQNLAHQ